LEARQIRSGASRDRHGNVVWLYFAAPHKHLVVDVTVTSTRTNADVPAEGASLPLPSNMAMRAQQAKMDYGLRTSYSLGTSSIQSVHDYYPFALKE
jgi:hypothetical protein